MHELASIKIDIIDGSIMTNIVRMSPIDSSFEIEQAY